MPSLNKWRCGWKAEVQPLTNAVIGEEETDLTVARHRERQRAERADIAERHRRADATGVAYLLFVLMFLTIIAEIFRVHVCLLDILAALAAARQFVQRPSGEGLTNSTQTFAMPAQ